MPRYRIDYTQTLEMTIEFDAESAGVAQHLFETAQWPQDAVITEYGTTDGDVVVSVEEVNGVL